MAITTLERLKTDLAEFFNQCVVDKWLVYDNFVNAVINSLNIAKTDLPIVTGAIDYSLAGWESIVRALLDECVERYAQKDSEPDSSDKAIIKIRELLDDFKSRYAKPK